MAAKYAVTAFFLLALAPSHALAHYDGELLPDSVAVMEYRMIINMNPADTLTRNKLGMVYVRQGKLDKARDEFMEILKMNPDDFDALDSLGIVYEKKGDYKEAAGWYGRALKVRKDDKGVSERYKSAVGKMKAADRK